MQEDKLLRCSRCKLSKLKENFHKSKKNKYNGGYDCYCKECKREINLKDDYYKNYIKNRRLKDPLKELFLATKRSAKRRGLLFELNEKFIIDSFNNQEGRCYYTKNKLDLTLGEENSISVDRKNPLLGYTIGNSVICSWKSNRMKNNATIPELIQFCKDIINNEFNIL